jgi:hypothetical protein
VLDTSKEESENLAGASQPQNQPSSLEEGMYYERVFGPEKVKVFFNEKKELAKLVFEDKNGQTLEVSDKRLVSRCLMYYAKYTDFKVSELRELNEDVLEKVLNGAIPKRDKALKALYDDEGKLSGIASTIHEQISWAKVKQMIEGTVKELTGEVIKPENFEHPFKWSYRVPSNNKNVSGWVGVHAGNNIIEGKSGIRIFSRFRTEKGGSGGRAACLNWCGMWQFPEQFFNVDVKRLDNIIDMLGKENVKDIEMFQFHLKGSGNELKQDLHEGIAKLIKAMGKVTPVINKSVHSPLSKTEMENILLAYQSKSKSFLPDYIIEQIMAHIEEETVWGFSQAVSWVRTHGAFKFTSSVNPMFKTVEDRELTWRLENIAGEVLSLTPTINDIHQKHGDLTLEFLVGEETAKAIREVQCQKIEKLTMKVAAAKA